MICHKCGAQIPEGSAFCLKCGSTVDAASSDTAGTGPKRIQLRCKACGALMDADEGKNILICPYCGSKELIADSDSVAIEKIRSSTLRDVEKGRQQVEREKLQHAAEQTKQQQMSEDLASYKKSKLRKWTIFFFFVTLLCCIVCFNDKDMKVMGVIALFQTVLFGISWAMGMQLIHEKRRNAHLIPAVAAFLLILAYLFALSRSGSSYGYEPPKMGDFTWPTGNTAALLPVPESTYGALELESADGFSAEVGKTSEKQFNAYIDACIANGFTEDYARSSENYNAENADGYQLILSYDKDKHIMSVWISAPKKPSTAVSASTAASASVDDISDAASSEVSAVASSVEAESAAILSSAADAASSAISEAASSIASSAASSEDTAAPAAADGLVTPSFKEAMDSYEAFFKEYAAFMKDYQKSDDPVKLLTKYSDYLSRYTDLIAKLDAIDESQLSAADDAYYLEVTARIYKILAETGS